MVARSICIEVLRTVVAYIAKRKATYATTRDIITNSSSLQVCAVLSLRQLKPEFLLTADLKLKRVPRLQAQR